MIGDVIAQELPVLRAHAVSLMRDACRVERAASGPRVLDEGTGQYPPAFTVVYEGRCRVQVAQTQPVEAVEGGRDFTVTDAQVQLPVDGTDYRDGDRVVVTASAADPALAGVVLTVVSREVKSYPVMRRLHVSEVRS